jgi:hypothetical protein
VLGDRFHGEWGQQIFHKLIDASTVPWAKNAQPIRYRLGYGLPEAEPPSLVELRQDGGIEFVRLRQRLMRFEEREYFVCRVHMSSPGYWLS